MQAIMETLFDTVYLISVMTIGIRMIWDGRGSRPFFLFGVMAVVLGTGDAFHLVPRAYALCTTGLASYPALLGLGTWITSVTMTVFYVLLYHVWRLRYSVRGQDGLTAAVYFLAGLRILLCMMPQNQWLSADAPPSWGIYRNIPFALLGLLNILLFYRSAKKHRDRAFRWMRTLYDHCHDVRRMGAASLCLSYVASGRLDAYVEDGLKPWDYAAGMLLVREAGGMAATPEGGEPSLSTGGGIAAANGFIGRDFLKLLSEV